MCMLRLRGSGDTHFLEKGLIPSEVEYLDAELTPFTTYRQCPRHKRVYQFRSPENTGYYKVFSEHFLLWLSFVLERINRW